MVVFKCDRCKEEIVRGEKNGYGGIVQKRNFNEGEFIVDVIPIKAGQPAEMCLSCVCDIIMGKPLVRTEERKVL